MKRDVRRIISNFLPFLLFIVGGIVIFEACFSGESKYEAIRIKGSDSEVNLVQVLAENFMDQDSLTSIGVTGGGSGAGISALINGKTDLANSSREITEEELFYAEKRKIDPYPIIFALDALAIIINENNPVDSLTISQLSQIYSGKVSNWKEFGGNDEAITLYGRQSSSGTFMYFRESIVKDEYSQSMIGMSGTAQIVDAIRTDKKGVGYVSSGYLNENVLRNLKVIKIKKDQNTPAYTPTVVENITSGHYPITRPLYQYANGKPKGKLLEYLLYQFSPEGSEIIQSNGFYSIDTEKIKAELTK